MARQTRVRATMPGPRDQPTEVEESWTILTHQTDGEWWSEVLDGNRHPQVHGDRYGFDTVRKFYGDSIQESRDAALQAVRELIGERGGRVQSVDDAEER